MALTKIGNEGGSTLSTVSGLCFENGNLWITDGGSHRVLRIPNASTMADGATANLVLGQINYTYNTGSQYISKFVSPYSVFYKDNTLWVSQQVTHKVFRFDNISSKSNGAAADAYLGNLSGTAGTSVTTFNSPSQVYVNINDNLWVADMNNNRVLKFENAKTFASGASAALVLGQPDFTTSTNVAMSSKTLRNAIGVYGDAFGNIYVGQNFTRRITIFKDGANMTSNYAEADFILGKLDFTTNASGPTEKCDEWGYAIVCR